MWPKYEIQAGYTKNKFEQLPDKYQYLEPSRYLAGTSDTDSKTNIESALLSYTEKFLIAEHCYADMMTLEYFGLEERIAKELVAFYKERPSPPVYSEQ